MIKLTEKVKTLKDISDKLNNLPTYLSEDVVQEIIEYLVDDVEETMSNFTELGIDYE